MACANNTDPAPPRVVIVGLASCFGCQLQITNDEAHLLDVLGQLDLRYWQLASSAPEPEGDVDVVVIEGAVTTEESRRCVEMWRRRARTVIAVGACAVTGGIPGMASAALDAGRASVYGGDAPEACGDMTPPRSVSSVVDVDFEVRSCPIDTADFITVLERALYGSNVLVLSDTMCGSCKRNEGGCFWRAGKQCLGLGHLGGLRREMREPRQGMQRLPRAFPPCQPARRAHDGRGDGHERGRFRRCARTVQPDKPDAAQGGHR